jgi:hypothetical protein
MSKKIAQASLIPQGRIEHSIFSIRGHRVMLSQDLAVLYGVSVSALIQAVKRNVRRFPDDFMFQLTRDEFNRLKSQFVTLGKSPRATPYAFTEQGVAMLSSVLRSERAVSVNIEIMRAFVRIRQLLAGHADLVRRLDELEKKYDKKFQIVFEAIRELMEPPEEPPKERIGFDTETKKP